jgi:pentatricopeptide repeat protein
LHTAHVPTNVYDLTPTLIPFHYFHMIFKPFLQCSCFILRRRCMPFWAQFKHPFAGAISVEQCKFLSSSRSFIDTLFECNKYGRWREALAIINKIKQEGTLISLNAYNVAISACAKQGQWKPAQSLYDDLKRVRLKPNNMTYSALISAYGKSLQWQKALRIFGEMKAAGVEANTITYSALISACETMPT